MAVSGSRNLITDVPGLLVGQAEDAGAITGAGMRRQAKAISSRVRSVFTQIASTPASLT